MLEIALLAALCQAPAAKETYDNPFEAYAAEAYEAALSLFLDAQVEHPDDPRLAYNAGNAAYKAKRYEDAARSYAQALQSRDASLRARAHYNLGNTMVQTQKLEEAIKHYEETLKLAPKDEDAHKNLAYVKKLLEQKKQQEQQGDQQDDAQASEDQSSQAGASQGSKQDEKDAAHSPDAQERQEGTTPEQQANNATRGERRPDEKTDASPPMPSEDEQPPKSQAASEATQQKPNDTATPNAAMEADKLAGPDALAKEAAARYLREVVEGKRHRQHKGRAKSQAQEKDW